MAITGNYIMVLRDGVLIAGTKSNEVQSACDMEEVSSPLTGTWREYKSGKKGWTVGVGFLILAMSNATELLSVGETYTLRFCDRNGNGVEGTALLKTCNIRATIGTLAQGSFAFQGTGPLVEVEQEEEEEEEE